MKTEVKPRIKSGFFVNEVELTRIKDAQNEQIKKKSGGIDAEFAYEIKYRNGVIHSPSSLAEIVGDENDGSKKVVHLSIVASPPGDASTIIAVRYSDISDQTNSDTTPISYDVISDDKDWTFVTASIIEERLNKTRISKLANWLLINNATSLIISSIPLLVMVILVNGISKTGQEKITRIKEARRTAKSLFDYVYKVDLINNTSNSLVDNMPFYFIGAFISSFAMGWLAKVVLSWFPAYTLYWGDGTKKYDGKISIIKFVVVGVIFALILGIVGNYFYDSIFH